MIRIFRHRPLQILGISLLVFSVGGCMGSPIYKLWYRKQWLEDEKYGATLHQRIEELAEVRRSASSLTADEQMSLAQQLTESLTNDPAPLYRAEVVRTLGALSPPAAMPGLRIALQDSDASVRMAACRAWGELKTDESAIALGQVLNSDEDLDVRIEAARQLGRFERQPAAVQALGVALDDRDPALQHRAVQSLKSVTGEDFGDSVPAWRQYVQGQPVEEPEPPSIAERMRNLF